MSKVVRKTKHKTYGSVSKFIKNSRRAKSTISTQFGVGIFASALFVYFIILTISQNQFQQIFHSLAATSPSGTSLIISEITTSNYLCVDDWHGGTTSGNKVDIWPCGTSNASQQWSISSTTNGTIKIHSLCLDVADSSKSTGAEVEIRTCNGVPSQLWSFKTIPSGPAAGQKELVNNFSGLCLADPAGTVILGTQLWQYTCPSKVGFNQAWRIANSVPTSTPNTPGNTDIIISGVKGTTGSTNGTFYCVDDYQNSTASANPVDIWQCSSTYSAEQWTISSNTNGTIKINSMCLDVKGNGKVNGTKVDLFKCNSQTNQEWTLTTISSGTAKGQKELVSKASGLCLDDTGGSTTDGTQLQIWKCIGDQNQVWSEAKNIPSGSDG